MGCKLPPGLRFVLKITPHRPRGINKDLCWNSIKKPLNALALITSNDHIQVKVA
jgi:hypothetical protein